MSRSSITMRASRDSPSCCQPSGPTIRMKHRLIAWRKSSDREKNSILYQQLTKNQKALSASVSNSTSELAGEFRFSVTPAPGISLAETKKLLDEAMTVF